MTLRFANSARSTVGIEWELALIDRESGELQNVAEQVLGQLQAPDYSAHPFITGELLLNTVELVTGVHRTIGGAVAELRDQLTELRFVTDPLGLELICAGSHPFARWTDQQIANKERYRKLIERTQWWGLNMMIWGVHVHVGVEDVRKALPLVHALTSVSPLLQALSASSPFWAGEATGYASNRALMFQQLPTAGLPYNLATWAEFESFVDDLTTTGVIEDVSEVRWDVRPAPHWGTIEFRACDGLSTAEEIAGVAAFIQCATDWFSAEIDAGRETPNLKPWFERENKWRAARYGLDAAIIIDNRGTEASVRDQIDVWLRRLEPVAERLNCQAELAHIDVILQRGAGYQRQLSEFELSNDLRRVTLQLARELRDGLA